MGWPLDIKRVRICTCIALIERISQHYLRETRSEHTVKLVTVPGHGYAVPKGSGACFMRELEAMKEQGCKMEIEGLYSVSGIGGRSLVDYIRCKIQRCEYI